MERCCGVSSFSLDLLSHHQRRATLSGGQNIYNSSDENMIHGYLGGSTSLFDKAWTSSYPVQVNAHNRILLAFKFRSEFILGSCKCGDSYFQNFVKNTIHFSAKQIKSYGNLESKCIFSIYMFDLQIVTTFPRSSK